MTICASRPAAFFAAATRSRVISRISSVVCGFFAQPAKKIRSGNAKANHAAMRRNSFRLEMARGFLAATRCLSGLWRSGGSAENLDGLLHHGIIGCGKLPGRRRSKLVLIELRDIA